MAGLNDSAFERVNLQRREPAHASLIAARKVASIAEREVGWRSTRVCHGKWRQELTLAGEETGADPDKVDVRLLPC